MDAYAQVFLLTSLALLLFQTALSCTCSDYKCYINYGSDPCQKTCCVEHHNVDALVLLPKQPKQKGCGIRRTPLGGPYNEVTTGYGEYPWMVAIFGEKHDGSNMIICAGALVHPSVLVTAAHCLRGNFKKMFYRIGEWEMESMSEPRRHEDLGALKTVNYPGFNVPPRQHDLALVHLTSQVTLSETVDLLCLSEGDMSTLDQDNCFVAGWGMNGFSPQLKYPLVLHRVNVSLVDRQTCAEKLSSKTNRKLDIPETTICATGSLEEDVCMGDGGDPLVCPLKAEPYRYALVGVVSWGWACRTGTPSVYTRVQHYASWIKENLPKTP